MNPLLTKSSDHDVAIDQVLRSICTQIKITKLQHALAVKHYRSVGGFLSGSRSPLAKYRPTIYSQGSFRIGTTNRPRGQDEFDLDFVCEFAFWSARSGGPDYLLHELYDCILRNTDFRQLVELKKRCVRLKYSGDFHMDILPAISDPSKGSTCIKVPDRELHGWTDSNPRGYANWFEDKATPGQTFDRKAVEPIPGYESVEQKGPLKLVVQLMKRARDVAFAGGQFDTDLAPPSIILTTLAANLYQGEDSVNQAISMILCRILQEIEDNKPGMLEVTNPMNPDETFSEQWEQEPESYRQFVLWIRCFANSWSQLQKQQGLPKIKRELEKLFGENVAQRAFSELAGHFERDRRNGILGISPSLGLVNDPTVPNTILIKPNTFYGEL